MTSLAEARGLWPFKRIFVHPDILRLPRREQEAVILHEQGHCWHLHVERRLARLWLFLWFPALKRYCRMQEFEADRYAAIHGYAAELIEILGRRPAQESVFHPSSQARIARLSGAY